MLNSLPRKDGSRAKWNTDITKKNKESEMYQLIISNMEDAQMIILNENNDMRQQIIQIQQEINHTLSHCNDENQDPNQDEINSNKNSDVCEKRIQNLPYDMIKQEIDESFVCKFTKLKNSIDNLKQNRKSKKSDKRKMDKIDRKEDILHKTYTIPEKFNNNLIKKQQLSILNEKSKLESQRFQNEYKKNLNEDKLNKLRKEEIKFQVNKKSWLKIQL